MWSRAICTGNHLTVILIIVVFSAGYVRADECLQTDAGTPLKVIVKVDTAMHTSSDPTTASEPVGAFSFFYVLPADAGGDVREKNGFVRVATAASVSREAGWLPAKDVVFWAHAQVVGFRQASDRQRMLFFAKEEHSANWLKQPDTAGKLAISREPDESASFGFFPLLDISSVEHEGYPTDIYKVAYVGGTARSNGESKDWDPSRQSAENGPQLESAITAEQLSAEFKLQIVFVVDSTASMGPWIDAMKIVVQRVIEALDGRPQLKGRLEFALVAYRDQVDPNDTDAVREIEYVTRVVSDFTTDLALIGDGLVNTSAATVSSEDFPEDILAGLNVSLHDLSWNRTASKHIILLGDAPAQLGMEGYKNTTKQTLDGILTLAQPTGPNATWERKLIHGLRVISEMEDVCKEHFEKLTGGRDFGGLHYAYADAGDEERFIKDLVDRLSQMADVTTDIAQGRLSKVADLAMDDNTDGDLRRLLGPILPMLRATSESTEAGFTEGYVSTIDPEGNAALEPYALVAQSQLKLFESALNHCVLSLENSGEAGSRDVQKVVQQLQVLATGVNLAEDVHPDMPLHELLSRALGFPLRSGIFTMTPRQLAAMTAADFEGWVNQVRASQSICKAHIDNTSGWFALGESGRRAAEKHAFIKVSDLP